MLSIHTILTFFAVSLALGFTPGPDNIAVLMQSATHGRKAGLFITLGLCGGLVVHTLAVALGLAAVFAASATAFAVLKVLGATYLAYLAWGAFRAPVSPAAMGARPASTPFQMFTRGMVMNLTNPKVVFFFLALLPQFVQADSGSVTLQLCALGLIFILATLVAFGTITYFSAAFSAGLRQSARAQRGLNYFAGSIFLGLAVRLALTER
jgi:threonine/homoserine/homoserine lactone efflux protein